MVHVIVERTFDEPLSDERMEASMKKLGPCLEQYGVRWLRSYLSNDRRRDICEYEAADAEAVRMAQNLASMPYVRVWTGTMLTPESVAGGG